MRDFKKLWVEGPWWKQSGTDKDMAEFYYKKGLEAQTEPVTEVPCSDGVIKPCPFCGSDNSHIEDAGYNHFAVRCRNGECKGQGLRDYDKQKAIDAWNERAL